MVTDTVESYLARERRRVDDALATIRDLESAGFREPLSGAVQYALSTPGKRLRPILCATAYRAATRADLIPGTIYDVAAAVEIVHTYSLVHDDLPCMDDDDLRRGRPTLHRVYGNAVATVAGAVLLPLAMKVLVESSRLLGVDGEGRSRLIAELAQAAGAEGMVGGQLLDLQAEGTSIGAADLERIHRRKTGALLTASLRLGALSGGAAEDLLQALTLYGNALGLAFQIADDLLDVEGSSGDLGKTAGRDAALSKASYPGLFGVDGARALARERIEEARAALAAFHLPELMAIADFVVERRR